MTSSISALAGLLEPGHGYVALVAVASVFVSAWAGIMVGKARKTYGIKCKLSEDKRKIPKRRME